MNELKPSAVQGIPQSRQQWEVARNNGALEAIMIWKKYHPRKSTGKLCSQYCTNRAELPLRDIFGDHKAGYKKEPNYETATYNQYSDCHQRHIQAAVRDGLSHLLFVTRYSGKRQEFRDRYFIIGYFEIGWTAKENKRTAIRARKMAFTPIEKAYEITDNRWKWINPHGKTTSLKNLRWASQRIGPSLLFEILKHLDRGNAIHQYLRETAFLKSNLNPFGDMPKGKIFIINVGANTASPLQSPLFKDGTFEIIPIREHKPLDPRFAKTFGSMHQFNLPTEPMVDLFQDPALSPSAQIHSDPEFLTLSYGDNFEQKSNLKKLHPGDFLFFLARLVPYQDTAFQHDKAIFALVGFLEVEQIIREPDEELFQSPTYHRNAHVIRWLDDRESFRGLGIIKGSQHSRRFRYAVPFNRKLVEQVPFLMADESSWDWSRTTELGVIGSNTRTVRVYIDPEKRADQKRADKFWEKINQSQRWVDMPELVTSKQSNC